MSSVDVIVDKCRRYDSSDKDTLALLPEYEQLKNQINVLFHSRFGTYCGDVVARVFVNEEETAIVAIGLVVNTGGIEGGNCWGRGGNRQYSNEIDYSEVTGLMDQVLLSAKPTVSFKEALEIKKQMLVLDHTQTEYYGNKDNFTFFLWPVSSLV